MTVLHMHPFINFFPAAAAERGNGPEIKPAPLCVCPCVSVCVCVSLPHGSTAAGPEDDAGRSCPVCTWSGVLSKRARRAPACP